MAFSILGAFVAKLVSGVGTYTHELPGGIWACEVPVAQDTLFPSAVVEFLSTDYVWIFERDYRESPRLVLSVYSPSAEVAEVLAREMTDEVLDKDLTLEDPNVTFQVFPVSPGLRVEVQTQSDFLANRVYRASVDFKVEIDRIDGRSE